MEFRISRADMTGQESLKPNELLPLESFELIQLLIKNLPKSQCRVKLIEQLETNMEESK